MSDEHLKRVQKQVDEMNKTFDLRTINNEPDPEPDPTQAPSTDSPEAKTDPPATDPPQDMETDQPKTQPPSTDPPDDKDEVIRKLREKLAEGDEKPPKTQSPSTKPPTTNAPLQDIDFVGELDLEDLTENKEELNKIFNKVMREAAKSGRVDQPDLMATIPSLVTAINSLQKATETFYEENPDLAGFKKVVGATFEELVDKNPDKKYDELINDVAPLVRQKLELPEPKKKGKDSPPRLPRKKAKSGRPPESNESTSLQSDIEAMNKSLGR